MTNVFLLPTSQTWLNALKRIEEANPATVIISFLAITALIVLVILDKLLKRLTLPIWYYSMEKHKWHKTKVKWSISIPSQLLVVGAVLNFSSLCTYIYIYVRILRNFLHTVSLNMFPKWQICTVRIVIKNMSIDMK